MRRWLVITFGLLNLVVANAARGAVIFSGTGRDLSVDPRVTFPIRPFQLIGDSIFFDSFGNQTSIAFRFPVIAAGAAVGLPMVVSFTAQLRRPESDHDPFFGVLAGGDARGVQFTDNFDGAGAHWSQTYGSDDVILTGTGSYFFTDAGYPAVGEDFTVSGAITLSDSATTLESSLGTGNGSAQRSALDLSEEVSFIVVPPGFDEELYLHHLEVSVFPIPEPDVAVVVVIGLVAGMLRRRR